MSHHRSHSDVENPRTSFISPRANINKADNVKLLQYVQYRKSRQLISRLKTSNRGKPSFWKKFCPTISAHITGAFVDGWVGETLAILLSITAFATVVGLLRVYDECKPPSWPYHLTLNFVVSTLATVAKSALLLAVASALGQLKWLWMCSKQRRLQDLQVFDEASRGPLGALRLLVSRGRL